LHVSQFTDMTFAPENTQKPQSSILFPKKPLLTHQQIAQKSMSLDELIPDLRALLQSLVRSKLDQINLLEVDDAKDIDNKAIKSTKKKGSSK